MRILVSEESYIMYPQNQILAGKVCHINPMSPKPVHYIQESRRKPVSNSDRL